MQPHQFKGHGWWHSVNSYCILHGTLNQNPQILDTPHSEHLRFKLLAIGHYNKQLACNLTREMRPSSQDSGSSSGGIGRNRASGKILRLKAKMPSFFSCGGSKSPPFEKKDDVASQRKQRGWWCSINTSFFSSERFRLVVEVDVQTDSN